ncbi:hypothetical protein GYMLUDRAFT_63850 [Collybiopsis luxurians FD-317 M1]|uniref:Uncharacterized protein n=1 Tax=Collybiopsis luxurians FD-317 M1 TaxID=944289 RepID=A0A0D0AS11_9AGAR|nr:hypothetical protein GYMLUDRAFT_63850 [Collybiopsis luxurians FD-317 M1]
MEPSDNTEIPSTLALQQQDINSPESDSEPEGPDIYQHLPSFRFPRQRESVYSSTSPHDLLHLLITRESESSELRKALKSAQHRAEEAEGQLAVYTERFRSLSHTLEEELALCKIQYDLAREEIVELRAQVERAGEDTTKAREELEAWKAGDEERRLGLESWWTKAREQLGIFVADPSQSDNQETLNEEQPWENDEAMRYSVYPPPRTLLPTPDFPDFPVVSPLISALRRQPAIRVPLPSAPHSRPTTPTPSLQMYDTEIPPADQVKIDNRPSTPDSEVLSTTGDLFWRESIGREYSNAPSEVGHTFSNELTVGGDVREYSRALSTVGTESITGGNRGEYPESTIGDMIWSEFQTYDIENLDSQSPEPGSGRSSLKIPPPQVVIPPARQARPLPIPPNNFIPAAQSEDRQIPLPPPHRLAEYPPSPQPSVGMTLPLWPPQSQQGVEDGDTPAKGKARATESLTVGFRICLRGIKSPNQGKEGIYTVGDMPAHMPSLRLRRYWVWGVPIIL